MRYKNNKFQVRKLSTRFVTNLLFLYLTNEVEFGQNILQGCVSSYHLHMWFFWVNLDFFAMVYTGFHKEYDFHMIRCPHTNPLVFVSCFHCNTGKIGHIVAKKYGLNLPCGSKVIQTCSVIATYATPDLLLQHLDKTVAICIWNNWNTYSIRLKHLQKHMKNTWKPLQTYATSRFTFTTSK
jgi:hypothetical protein